MSDNTCDVTIIGAGPAGATAAILLANSGRNVALVDRAKLPRPVPCGGWLTPHVAPLLANLGVDTKKLLARPFRHPTFHSADFSKRAEPQFDDAVGYLVDRPEFDHALVKAATKSGATLHEESLVVDIHLRESSVDVVLDGGRTITSRLLLLASGRDSELLDRTGFSTHPGETPIYVAQVEGAVPSAKATDESRVAVVLGLDGGPSFAFCSCSNGRVRVNVSWMRDRFEVVPMLERVCRAAFENDLVPIDLTKQAGSASVIRSPASAALDMDTHVGKHTLLIGDAGGFVSAASNEGVYPAMWSAHLAVKVLESALDSKVSQDELMTFDTTWRMEMVDYLRSPHTDVRFLIPLVFTNQPMADRMGAAFFFGENI